MTNQRFKSVPAIAAAGVVVAGLSACSSNVATPTGTPAANTPTTSTQNSQTTQATQSNVPDGGPVTDSTGTAVHRKYALDVFSKPGSVSYLVGDRNQAGGMVVSSKEDRSGGARTGEMKLANPTLEGGDSFAGVSGLPISSDKTENGRRSRTYTKTDTSGNMTLSVVDSQFAQTGVYTSFSNATQEMHTGMFFGAADPSVVNNAPSASATYTGQAGAQLIAVGGVTGLEGDLTLNANIGAGSVSGEIANIKQTFQNGSTSNANFKINLNSAAISGNTYSGGVAVVDSTSGATVVNTTGTNGRANYSGGFFGPNGEETAGMIDVTGTGVDPQTGNSGRLDIFGVYLGK